VREVTGKPTGIKMCVGSVGTVRVFRADQARGESAPDFITVDGGEGGTGAAPMPLMDLVGMPIREALPHGGPARPGIGLHDRIRMVAAASW
jgi:glutamate synthase domain-containing protein 2